MISLLIILLLFLCSIIFIYRFFTKFLQNQKGAVNGNLPLPPGSKGWPFLGENLDYIYHIHNGVPEKFAENRKKYYSSQVFKTSLIGKSMAILCGPEGNKFLFSNEKKLLRVWLPPFFDQFFPKTNNKSNLDEMVRSREIISSFLKPRAIQESVGVMDSEMKQHLVSNWNGDDHKVEVGCMARKYISELSLKLFTSIDDVKKIDELSKMIKVTSAGVFAMDVNLPGTRFNRGMKASNALIKEFEKVIRQRRIDISEKCSSTVPQDVITLMLTNTDENGQFLNEYDSASHLTTLLEAANANTHNTITLVMMYLTELPDVYDKVLREQMKIAESKEPNDLLDWEDLSNMSYTWNVVREVLRFFPPIGTFREAITDFEYAGYLIPKGWMMHLMPSITHMNPKYFPDPFKFDPTRFEGNGPAPYTYIPFGGGPRMCPGITYVRFSILVFIHNVVTKFKWERIIPDEKVKRGPISSPVYGLPIRYYPLNP